MSKVKKKSDSFVSELLPQISSNFCNYSVRIANINRNPIYKNFYFIQKIFKFVAHENSVQVKDQ